MHILIAIPTFENILPDTFKSIYGLRRPEGASLLFDFVRGYDCARARNVIAQEAIDHGFDYVFMVDSDIILPSDALVKLLRDDPDVVLGCYPQKNNKDGLVEIFKNGNKDYVNRYMYDELDALDGHVDVKGGGFGCALIRCAIFNHIQRPWFKYVEYLDGSLLSEDNYFCGLARDTGFKVQMDPEVRCGHSIRGFQWR